MKEKTAIFTSLLSPLYLLACVGSLLSVALFDYVFIIGLFLGLMHLHGLFFITVHDAKAAIPVLSTLEISGSNILGDKAYGTAAIRKYITEQNSKYTIPPKENNPDPWYCDFWVYKERHLVECLFNKIKAFRRVATCYDKLDSSFLAFVYVASIFLLSK